VTDRADAGARAGVELMLAGRCNLACGYCYQDRRQVRAAIERESVRAALDVLLFRDAEEFVVEFSGGEPLLEPELLRWAVGHARRRRPAGKLSFILTTNGTLLTRRILDFLVEHAFRLRLSFDGLPTAQDLRSPRTFAVLDRLLDLLRREYPTFLAESVNVGMTLVASTIPHLAGGVRYLVGKGVPIVGVGPRSTWEPDWNGGTRQELQAQVEQILGLSLDHWRRTGLVPVEFLSGAPLRNPAAPLGEFLCGSVRGEAFVVDPDGHAWACPFFASSLCSIRPLAAGAARVMALGEVGDAGLGARLGRLPAAARRLRVFTDKRAKRSSYGRCADCRFVADCHVCPASICHIPGNKDPDRVPDFVCGFNQVTLAARERFDEMTGGELSAGWYRKVEAALTGLASAVEATVPADGQAGARTGAKSVRRETATGVSPRRRRGR
jgi:sulfatase maturation enzyme AslB (radical SAM superfamily)